MEQDQQVDVSIPTTTITTTTTTAKKYQRTFPAQVPSSSIPAAGLHLPLQPPPHAPSSPTSAPAADIVSELDSHYDNHPNAEIINGHGEEDDEEDDDREEDDDSPRNRRDRAVDTTGKSEADKMMMMVTDAKVDANIVLPPPPAAAAAAPPTAHPSDGAASIPSPTKFSQGPRNHQTHPSQKECRIYVGNLSWEVGWAELNAHLAPAGTIIHTDVLTMRDGKSRGCAIVEFASPEQAQEAIRMFNDSTLCGRPIFLREDRVSELRVTPSRFDSDFDRGRKVYIGNLPYSVTWQNLKDEFKFAGPIIRVDILMNSEGRSKGCGTILFEKEDDARYAMQKMDRYMWGGRQIEVREDRFVGGGGAPPSGGGGGYSSRDGSSYSSREHHQRDRHRVEPYSRRDDGDRYRSSSSSSANYDDRRDHRYDRGGYGGGSSSSGAPSASHYGGYPTAVPAAGGYGASGSGYGQGGMTSSYYPPHMPAQIAASSHAFQGYTTPSMAHHPYGMRVNPYYPTSAPYYNPGAPGQGPSSSGAPGGSGGGYSYHR